MAGPEHGSAEGAPGVEDVAGPAAGWGVGARRGQGRTGSGSEPEGCGDREYEPPGADGEEDEAKGEGGGAGHYDEEDGEGLHENGGDVADANAIGRDHCGELEFRRSRRMFAVRRNRLCRGE